MGHQRGVEAPGRGRGTDILLGVLVCPWGPSEGRGEVGLRFGGRGRGLGLNNRVTIIVRVVVIRPGKVGKFAEE